MTGIELHESTAVVMVVALLAYALLGGADFGAGVWDLLATGPRKREQRERLQRAIGPIWEANHVWLIVVIVVLFVCFPPAFRALGEGLHVCLTLMLFGIVLRGSAFVFRAYSDDESRFAGVWGRVFSASSVFTPIMLGAALAAMASGALTFDDDGRFAGSQWTTWLAPFPMAVGVFVLCAFAHLAAVYLCVEIRDDEALRADFRRRAWWSAGAMFVAGGAARLFASGGAPEFASRLMGSWWSLPLSLGAGALLLASALALARGLWGLARLCSAGVVTLLVAGFGAAQWPWLVRPEASVDNAAAPDATHTIVLAALGAGSLILIPSLIYLMRIFKGERSFALLK